jgi:hypothetical protein
VIIYALGAILGSNFRELLAIFRRMIYIGNMRPHKEGRSDREVLEHHTANVGRRFNDTAYKHGKTPPLQHYQYSVVVFS